MDIVSPRATSRVEPTDDDGGPGAPGAPPRHRVRRGMAIAAIGVLVAACGSTKTTTSPTSPTTGGSTSAATAGTASTPLSLVPASVRAAGTVQMATDANWPVCEFYPNGSNTMVGYEVDIWNAIGAKLGLKIKPTNVGFDSLIPGVQSGRFATSMACFSDSPQRESQVTFVDYSYDTNAVYVTKANPGKVSDSPLSLCGLTTATQTGTDSAAWVGTVASAYCTKHGKKSITNLQFPSENSALLALYEGKADFIIDDAASGAYIEEHAPKPVETFTDPLQPKYYIGILFNRKATQLTKAFLAGLKAIQADGEYAKIMTKWKVGFLSLPKPGINLEATSPLPTPKA